MRMCWRLVRPLSAEPYWGVVNSLFMGLSIAASVACQSEHELRLESYKAQKSEGSGRVSHRSAPRESDLL
jgi:hypothetical protein